VEAAFLLGLEAEVLQFLAAALRQEVLAEPGVDLLDELGLVLHLEDLGACLPLLLQLLDELLRVAALAGGVPPCDDLLLVVRVLVELVEDGVLPHGVLETMRAPPVVASIGGRMFLKMASSLWKKAASSMTMRWAS